MQLHRIALIHFRKFAGYSQAELARQSGLSQSYINELEAGHGKAASPATIRKLATALKLPIPALLSDPDAA